MNDKHEQTYAAVSLAIDFGDGAVKSYGALPWNENMTVLEVLDRADSIGPGLSFDFDRSFVDRGNRNVGTITTIDGVAGGADKKSWQLWMNGKHLGRELRIPASPGAANPLPIQAGDAIAFKLTANP